MIYLISFLRRVKFKSAFYFSLPPAVIVFVATSSPLFAAISILGFTFLLQGLSHIINYWDCQKKTNIQCPMCSHEHSVLLYPARKKKSRGDEKGSFACSSFDHGIYPNIYFCPLCKNGFLESLVPEKYEETVQEGHQLYEDVVDDTYLKNIDSRYTTYQAIVEQYSDYLKDKDVLEVGAYYGVFYNEARGVVKSYTGVEPSKHACTHLKEKYPDINIINNNLEMTLENDLLPQKEYDTIVLWDVIEHLPNPIETLRQLNQVLKPGGHIIFSTINIESSFSLILGPIWPWFMDMHYYYFSDRGYVDMLHRSGYVIKGHYHFKYYVYLSYFLQKVFKLALRLDLSNNSFISKRKEKIPIQFGDTVLVIGKKENL